MEKYVKKIKIICIILAIIIVVIFIIILIARKIDENQIDEYDSTQGELGINNVDSTIQNVDIRNNFYAVKTCLTKFYTVYFETTNTSGQYIVDEEQSNYNQEYLYAMLDEEYREFKDVTVENVLENIPQINNSDIEITTMYVSQRTPNVAVYFVYGYFNDRVNNEQTDFYNILKMDMLNNTFKIILQDLAESKYNDIEVGNSFEIEEFSEIENENNANIFEYESITDEEYVEDIFNQYRQNLIYNRPLAYEQLESEYREKRFPTYEVFEEYVKENSRRNVLMKIEKYQKNVYDEYTQYVCVDTTGKYYIFNVTHVAGYGAILDTHSIDLPQFVEQYEKSNNQQKVGMNIEKILDALNEKDYAYIYNKLDETFKENNFSDMDTWEEYVRNNFYDSNDFTYNNISEEQGVYVTNVVVNNSNEESESKNITFIMNLTENNDFIVSFSIN